MAKKLLLFVCIILFSGCSAVEHPKTYPVSLTPEISKAWKDAEGLVSQGRYKEADLVYDSFIQNYGYNPLTDRAYFKKGEIKFLDKKYEDAVFYYRKAYSNIYSPSVTPKSQFKAAYSLYLLKRFNEAEEELKGVRRSDVSTPLKVRIDSLGVNISKSGGFGSQSAILWYLFLVDDYFELSGRKEELKGFGGIVSENEVLFEVRKWVENDLVTSDQIAKLPLKSYEGKPSGGYVFFKLGKTLNKEGDFKRATKELKEYSFAYPKHEYYEEAKYLLGESAGMSGDVSAKVGLILPLSERYSVYGESVLRGVECAVGVFEPCKKRADIQLVVRDSEGGLEKALSAVDDLAGQGVVAIIGAILSATAEDIAKKSQELGIPLITLSQRDDLPRIGDYIFRNTVTAASQADVVADYAVNKKELKRFLILYPKNKSGDEYKELFSASVSKNGGNVSVAYPYSPSRVEFSSELMSIPIKEDAVKGKFDAIFVPDSFDLVGYLVPTLAMMGIKGFPYFGISRWNDPRIVTLGGEYVEGAVFPEAFYKDITNPLNRDFFTEFSKAYGIKPTLLEGLGFDSMLMIIDALEKGVSRGMLKGSLSKIKDFEGVTGSITFNENRDAVRKLPLLTIFEGNIVPLSSQVR